MRCDAAVDAHLDEFELLWCTLFGSRRILLLFNRLNHVPTSLEIATDLR